ncbi:heterokaryon incompatibility protein-domain-containing protein [Schizothecium vesticola]|uniref:Heterokaryon incompatibility protein-domain-containing protein n=1 Tax=Schizothecium vesticola TaxID=314040 RepID=A0AA40ER28_9PEZI|nr:heterokaryon incompatibility protein-domain-containing protein [Schizothecium vesticola]
MGAAEQVTNTSEMNSRLNPVPKLRKISRKLIENIIRKVLRLKSPALDIDDETDEEDDIEFDWRRPELAPYLPYVDKNKTTNGTLPRLDLDPSWVDCEHILRWLRICDEQHGDHCGGDSHQRTRPRWLVDVDQLCLVPAWGTVARYFALSYVWGRIDSFQATKSNLERLQQADALRSPEPRLPKTIQDAIFLVRRLGGRYLWVDQLCIPQDDEEVKSVELGAMAVIYRNAYATIVAAQGEHADEGLHGVQTVPRMLWSCGRREDHEWWYSLHLPDRRDLTLARPPKPKDPRSMDDREMMQRFGRVLLRTTWYSRGWTFQEQLFSPRKIYFHNDTVNWDCHCRSFHESQDVSPASPGLGLCPRTRTETETAFIDSATWPNFHRYARLVAIYNIRRLSREEDALDAFEGVLSSLSKVFPGSFLSGLPSLFFDAALLWQPYTPVVRRVASEEATTAAAVLPSWSWVGWQGNFNSESWRSGHDYLRSIDARGIYTYKPRLPPSPTPQCSWHTLPTVPWSHSATMQGERTPISSAWRLEAQRYATTDVELPSGWTRHRDWKGTVFFKHESDAEQEFTYPIPLSSSSSSRSSPSGMEPQAPARPRFLHGRTRRARLRFGESFQHRPTSHCTAVDLVDDQGAWAGVLRLNCAVLDFRDVQEYLAGETCELVELSAGEVQRSRKREEVSFDEWDRPGCPRTRGGVYEFYNVMWIEWVGAVAQRKAVGRVERRAWQRLAGEEVDVCIG